MTATPLLALGLLLSAAPKPSAAADEVKALLLRQAEAWNRGDLDAFCAVYAEDAVFVSPKGVTRGRAEVLARYRSRYPDQRAMGTLSFKFDDVRVSAEHVSVAAEWHLAYPDKPEAHGHTLVVFVKRGAEWKLVQDASM